MAKSYKVRLKIRYGAAKLPEAKSVLRVVVGILALANLVAVFLIFRPPGGSAEDLENELSALRKEQKSHKATIDRLKILAGKSEHARDEGDIFMGNHFLARRIASSTLVHELLTAAKEAGIRPKEHAFQYEPVEG